LRRRGVPESQQSSGGCRSRTARENASVATRSRVRAAQQNGRTGALRRGLRAGHAMDRILMGDIVWAELNPGVGREQAGQRPVVVLSHDVFNERPGTVIAVAVAENVVGEDQPDYYVVCQSNRPHLYG